MRRTRHPRPPSSTDTEAASHALPVQLADGRARSGAQQALRAAVQDSPRQTRMRALRSVVQAQGGLSTVPKQGVAARSSLAMDGHDQADKPGALHTPAQPLRTAAAGAAVVQCIHIVKDGSYRLARKDELAQAQDTATLDDAALQVLLLELHASGKQDLVKQISQEREALAAKDKKGKGPAPAAPRMDELLKLSEAIEALKKQQPDPSKFSKSEHEAAAHIAESLRHVQAYVSANPKAPEAGLLRDTAVHLDRELRAASGGGGAAADQPVYDLNITAQHRTDYRNEIRAQGTYASLGEGSHLANRMNMQVPVFIIVDGHFVQVEVLGRNHARVGTWAIVHLGNHYEAVSGVNNGMAVGQQTGWVRTAPHGDCLFESLLVVRNRGRQPRNMATQIEHMRRRVAADMSDAEIDHNLQEMILFGNLGRAGPKTQKLVGERRQAAEAKSDELNTIKRADAGAIDHEFGILAKMPGGIGQYKLDGVKRAYLDARAKAWDADETIAAYRELREAMAIAIEAYNHIHGADSFQQANKGADVQNRLTEKHWVDRLQQAKGASAVQAIEAHDYWEKGGSAKGAPRRLEDILTVVGPALLNDLKKAGSKSKEQLKLYRSMSYEEAQGIMDWFKHKKTNTEALIAKGGAKAGVFHGLAADEKNGIGIMPVRNHMGDRDQAEYYYRPKKNAMVEFTLKPGAHDIMFTPAYLAVARAGRGANRAMVEMQGSSSNYPAASIHEGGLGGYIGVKAEAQGDFSLGVGVNDASRLLLQLLVESVRIVGN
ncbi:hypothetical protein [Massilia sp. TS11]|uniref:hypothetical protein n=1 Tax=Massilia sp. TS11 TaxID=2908003 RepID=UPI001EDA0D12|nr:hypothetical protein [Massilia sp. TS11]MCG2584165.1 hypothetical protein [Massilia sp. TS11]